MERTRLENPIINSAYAPPARHHEFDADGRPTGAILDGRRPSDYFVPIPPPKKSGGVQLGLALEVRREAATLVNEVRPVVDLWRSQGYPGLDRRSPSRLLLHHWRDDLNPDRGRRLYFAQIEALETLIYLTEVAAERHDLRHVFERLTRANADYNEKLPRIASKMATGSGKTAVLGMIIAWQTLNRAEAARTDERFCDRFLVVTPGITVRDRLRVLLPNDERNVYDQLDLVPSGELRRALNRARIVVANYHQFIARPTVEASATTRKLAEIKSTEESPAQVVDRVCKGLIDGTKSGVVVLNDEAHHCYRPKPADERERLTGEERREAEKREEDARVWFDGLRAVHKRLRVRRVFDVSATPFFLRGSGYGEGKLFPWVVSDFSLIDAIESGIVKVPRVPVADNAQQGDLPAYRNVYALVRNELPKRALNAETADLAPNLPDKLEGALASLYADYKRTFDAWAARPEAERHPTPPVFIVVCNNTGTSDLVYRHVAGWTKRAKTPDGQEHEIAVPGALDLFSNVEGDRFMARPRTILVDSAELERGEGLSPQFRKSAEAEIAAFKAELRARGRADEAEKIGDADLLREVLNTVGVPGRLGETVRCVVSVSMLTEGWDCNTVTHILGVRAFGTQLLCEQVIGRGLRRRDFTVDAGDRFKPEFCEVYGVPFTFLPVAEGGGGGTGPVKTTHVRALPDRADLEIRFPRLLGYRFEVPTERLHGEFGPDHRVTLSPEIVPTWTEVQTVLGQRRVHTLDEIRALRDRTVVFHLAKEVLERHYPDPGGQGGVKHWLFPQLLGIAQHWYDTCVDVKDGAYKQLLAIAELQAFAREKIQGGIVAAFDDEKRLMPVTHPYEPVGTSAAVNFHSGKKVFLTRADKCQVSHVVCDTDSWEQKLAQVFEEDLSEVEAYVKNDHLGFVIPYTMGLDERRYLPDFIVRTRGGAHLIVELTGHKKPDKQVKVATARDYWVPAVNNHGGFGRWGFVEITDPYQCVDALRAAIRGLGG